MCSSCRSSAFSNMLLPPLYAARSKPLLRINRLPAQLLPTQWVKCLAADSSTVQPSSSFLHSSRQPRTSTLSLKWTVMPPTSTQLAWLNLEIWRLASYYSYSSTRRHAKSEVSTLIVQGLAQGRVKPSIGSIMCLSFRSHRVKFGSSLGALLSFQAILHPTMVKTSLIIPWLDSEATR